MQRWCAADTAKGFAAGDGGVADRNVIGVVKFGGCFLFEGGGGEGEGGGTSGGGSDFFELVGVLP